MFGSQRSKRSELFIALSCKDIIGSGPTWTGIIYRTRREDLVMHRIFPLVTISEPAARKLWTYTCAAQGEISGIGEVEWDDTSIRIADIMHFLPQKGSDASTELD